ncbi:MAG: hypothetical protein AB8G05_20770 [Oligoflexales bacterium]
MKFSRKSLFGLGILFSISSSLVAEATTKKNQDPLNWCSGLELRDMDLIKNRIFDLEPPYEPTAGVSDVLSWLAEASRRGKMLMIDERYGSCLGCMNTAFGNFIGYLQDSETIIYGVVDFEDITGGKIDVATSRKPYNRIDKEEGYKFTQFMTLGKYQDYNDNKIVESYPLVPYKFRDGEPTAMNEDQPRRIFSRPHFPNLMLIDGRKIDQGALNSLCFQHKWGPNLRFEEREDGINVPVLKAYKEMLQAVLPHKSVLLQMVGPNLYLTGSEDAADFVADKAITTVECAVKNQKASVSEKCDMFIRDGFPTVN